ncbi:MAG: TIGR01459 family HAD-type hydrolase [Pseudomonadota bacterium]
MTELIDRFEAISDRYDAAFVDLWGCYHNGLTPYPAALEALRRYRAAGGIAILLTNAPRPAEGVARFLAGIGAPSDTHDGIMSSGEACQRAMAAGTYGRRYHYVGPPRDLGMLHDLGFEDTPAEEADAVLLVGFEDDVNETPATYDARIALWRARKMPVLCANPDVIVDRGEERLWCAGAIAQRHEEQGGRVIWYGKPHAPSYEAAFALLSELSGREIPRERIIGIGDGLHTDCDGAHAQGMDSLFISGGIAAADVASVHHPDPDHPDPARLADLVAQKAQPPRFAMGRFR